MVDFTGFGAAFSFAQDIIDKIFPDKEGQAKDREEFMLKATELDNQLAQSQIQVNTQEATNENLFVSGWRPFIGWVCGSAFLWTMLLQPIILFIMAAQNKTIVLPTFDTTTLNTTLMGLLGLGTLRTVEKVQAMNLKGK